MGDICALPKRMALQRIVHHALHSELCIRAVGIELDNGEMRGFFFLKFHSKRRNVPKYTVLRAQYGALRYILSLRVCCTAIIGGAPNHCSSCALCFFAKWQTFGTVATKYAAVPKVVLLN